MSGNPSRHHRVSRWLNESLYAGDHGLGYRQGFRVTKVLLETQTALQSMAIWQTDYFGRVLVLDGVIQTTERDEFVYHEMLVHQPFIAHGEVKSVLIIGGGDGGVLRECMRHPIDRAVMVEIDSAVVAACQTHMPKLSNGAFDDPRAELVIGDGFGYVAEAQETFDIIIVDSTDPFGPGEALFTDDFYANCRRVLHPGGIMVTQNGVPFFQGEEVTTTKRRMVPHFKDVAFYGAVVPTYVGGFMTLAWASDDTALRNQPENVIAERASAAGITARYWSPAMHNAAFVLPPFIAELYVD